MIPLKDAQSYVMESMKTLESENVHLLEGRNRFITEPIMSTESIPPFDNTAVDGYAVKAIDTKSAAQETPVSLKVLETIAAGKPPTFSIQSGECSKIMTGAPIPDGADAVVMVEWTEQQDSESVVAIKKEISEGQHIRRSGEDLEPGDLVISEGTSLNAAHLGLLASLGIYQVAAIRTPTVGIFSTGDELIEGPQQLKPGQIRDSNRFSLLALLERDGFQTIDFGLIPDNETAIEETIKKAQDSCDALITTGGVSMGDFDYVKIALNRLGEMRWMQVAIKPAKPLAFGIVNELPVFGLPGNPVSSMVSYELFARPALKKMSGDNKPFRTFFEGEAAQDFKRKPDGKTHFFRVSVDVAEGAPKIHSAGHQGSHQLTGMAGANALAILPDGNGVTRGSTLDFLFLD
ncbi:MAG: hypothetical protein CL453_03385 [Acidimicrobiaceae bacterium]|nr:hypothetical protein [Acidimicrobiaceae bacterium]